MSDINVGIEPIDPYIDAWDDLWWVFYLRDTCRLETYQELIRELARYEFQIVREWKDDVEAPKMFQAVLYDNSYSTYFEIINAPDTPMFYIGTYKDDFLPSSSPTARLNSDWFLEIGKICYQVLRPIYGFAEDMNAFVDWSHIEHHRLTHVFWAQLFDKEFVQQLQLQRLLGAPAWRNENLSDGGLLYVLAATPYLNDGPRQFWQPARNYFARQGFLDLEWSG